MTSGYRIINAFGEVIGYGHAGWSRRDIMNFARDQFDCYVLVQYVDGPSGETELVGEVER
jgi:hypothetical protein